MENTAMGLADAIAQARQLIERAGWCLGITQAWYAVTIHFKCTCLCRLIREVRSEMHSKEWSRDVVRERAVEVGKLVEKFGELWNDESRRVFERNSFLRFAMPAMDNASIELEDFEEALALASSERFSDFVKRSLEEPS